MSCRSCGARCEQCGDRSHRENMRRRYRYCQCGCGELLTGKRADAMFVNHAHGKRAYRREGRLCPAEQRRLEGRR